MTCQECEFQLGLGEYPEGHLATCAACRSIAEEMRLNSVALAALRDDPLPAPRRVRVKWMPLAAAAAAAIVLVVLPFHLLKQAAVPPPKLMAVADTAPRLQERPAVSSQQPQRRHPAHLAKIAAPAEPLKVKMFTSDPDVVIYWLISPRNDKKEGIE